MLCFHQLFLQSETKIHPYNSLAVFISPESKIDPPTPNMNLVNNRYHVYDTYRHLAVHAWTNL